MHAQQVVNQQIVLYGEPLADRFRRLLLDLGISQSRSAAIIGLSAPMLSQLINAQRVKISNPSVFARIVRLEEVAQQCAGDRSGLDAGLAEVAASTPVLSTVPESPINGTGRCNSWRRLPQSDWPARPRPLSMPATATSPACSGTRPTGPDVGRSPEWSCRIDYLKDMPGQRRRSPPFDRSVGVAEPAEPVEHPIVDRRGVQLDAVVQPEQQIGCAGGDSG